MRNMKHVNSDTVKTITYFSCIFQLKCKFQSCYTIFYCRMSENTIPIVTNWFVTSLAHIGPDDFLCICNKRHYCFTGKKKKKACHSEWYIFDQAVKRLFGMLRTCITVPGFKPKLAPDSSFLLCTP